jgi:curved DNA-binding protein CbpA
MSARPLTDAATTPSLLAHQLSRLARRHATGLLTSATADCSREIIVIDGEVRSARSNIEEEMLGLWLVRHGAIEETERAGALLIQGSADAPPLGHVLVTRGLLTQDLLEQHLQQLTVAIVERAVKEKSAELVFHEDPYAEHLDTLGVMTTTDLILVAARAEDDLDRMLGTLGEGQQSVTLNPDLAALTQGLSLTPTEGFMLSRVEGASDLDDLYRISSLPHETAVGTVFALAMAGLVVLSPAAKRRPAPHTVRTREAQSPKPVNLGLLTRRQREERATIERMATECERLNHYQALGVSPDATAVRILDAWNTIRQRYSEARTSERHLRDAEPWLTAIRERAMVAYEVLGNARTRDRYDSVIADITAQREAAEGKSRTTDAGAREALVEANLKQADVLIRQGELHLAVQLLEQACAIDPRPAELVKLARLLLRNPLWDQRALRCLRTAIEIEPDHVDAWLELAEFWRRHKNQERQRKSLERLLAIEPDHERANMMYQQLVGAGPLKKLRRLASRRRR